MEEEASMECELCRVAYSTEQELQEHNWSLMHHIKIEQTKKGAPHSCSLCMETCANIIEYGKHLNEDKHKIALSRLSQGGSVQMLDSFGLIPHPGQTEVRDKTAVQDVYDSGYQEQFDPYSRQTYSQPIPPSDMEILPDFQQQDEFKQPRRSSRDRRWKKNQWKYPTAAWPTWDELGDSGYESKSRNQHGMNRTPQDQYWNQNYVQNSHNQSNFYDDNFNVDWNDSRFYSEQSEVYDQHGRWGSSNYRQRRGSLDESFRGGNISHINTNVRRGRRLTRGRNHVRTHSYDLHRNRSREDKYSPESNSSSDSNGLKRRLEDNDLGAPEKSRRKNTNGRTRSVYTNIHNNSNELLEGRSNLNQRNRSSSQDMFSQSEPPRLRSNSQLNTSRRVTWSDQQTVSSTTDTDSVKSHSYNTSLGHTKSSTTDLVSAVADSSTEISKTKKKGKGNAKKGTSGKNRQSQTMDGLPDNKTGDKDSTESVLEKAEKLCKKLRNEREKVRQQKLNKEKQKKVDKTEELNTQIAELSKENMRKITGHLLTAEKVTYSDREKLFDSDEPFSESKVYETKDTLKLQVPSNLNQGNINAVSEGQTPTKKAPTSSNTSADPKIAERIAQTRADIDAIRAKIEGSVQADLSKPVVRSPPITNRVSPLSSTRKPDNKSLLKMVNAPRTTRERLHVAEMIRNHAKSQSRFSLPRFNLKMSDLVENQTELEDLSEFSIETLAPSVQLEIANLIEADIKPDVTELQLLLDTASAQNTELDSNILSELGIPQTPAKSGVSSHVQNMKPTSPMNFGSSGRQLTGDSVSNLMAPERDTTRNTGTFSRTERSSTPVSSRRANEQAEIDLDYADNKPSLSVEELVTEVNKAKEHLLGVREREWKEDNQTSAVKTTAQGTKSRFTASLPISDSHSQTATRLSSSLRDTQSAVDQVKIKLEKHDEGYEQALSPSGNRFSSIPSVHNENQRPSSPKRSQLNSKSAVISGNSSGNLNRDSGLSVSTTATPSVQTVHRSVHTKHLFPAADEMPVRDTDRTTNTSLQTKNDSTVERVNAILNAVPNMENMLTTGQLSGQSGLSAPSADLQPPKEEKDKQMDSSVNSNTSSVLDQVYTICMEEENVRNEINSVDAKIDKLKNLISEAQLQLNTFSEKRRELTSKESEFRSSRMKLLQDSRSLQDSSGSQSGGQPGPLSYLTEAQIQNLNNPVLVKFLMSQRQSDLSSIGGYSNVESGSQPDEGQDSQRRGSMTSVTSEHGEPVKGFSSTTNTTQNLLFSQSIDILSGSTDTLTSLTSQKEAGNQERDSGAPIPADISKRNDAIPAQETNSFSLLKHPMQNFVTLEALMNGDTEIGKLIHKNLESIQKGEVKQEQEVVIKTPESTGSGTKGYVSVKGRHESALSVVSDDMCISGSDTEKRNTGKVSMKYMGSLPEGLNYDSIMKQISSGSKNKPVMVTVLSSPEPTVPGKSELDRNANESPLATAAAELNDMKPFIADFGLMYDNKSPRSDTTSTLTLDQNEAESLSARSNFSLGEQIKRMCDGQTGGDLGDKHDLHPPKSDSSGEKTLEDESNKITDDKDMAECFMRLEKLDPKTAQAKQTTDKMALVDPNSPVRKKLKSKRERDQKSRRKQKELFILQSDTNSEAENGSQNSGLGKSSKSNSISEEDIVLTGSEDARTPRINSTPFTKRSLLDEVQLETETHSDSGEDKSKMSEDIKNRLTIQPERLENFRNNVKTKLAQNVQPSTIEYKGPSLSVTAIQLFKGDVYVCYNGSELRRFELKTGKILRELDCSPYLVSCLHVTSVEERDDILYTAGTCKKLMIFNPTNFSLISTLAYSERILCLHENWGRLFIGLSDGSISVRSLKTDKELNTFSCTGSSIRCLSSASAGMTKMLCLGSGDKVVYIVDAITGLLITMLEGHTLPPLCIQVIGEKVITGSADHTILVHNVSSGQLIKTVTTNKASFQLWTDGSDVYASSQDHVIRVYNSDFNLRKVHTTEVVVTYGMIDNGLLFTGYCNGMVESVPLSSFWAKT